jgi:L-cysteine S-thiosulfotransferase
MKKTTLLAAAAAIPLITTSLTATADESYRNKAIEVFKSNFVATGQAHLTRLDEDSVQNICNRTVNNPPHDIATKMESDQLAGVKWPADGKLMGDWKVGEKLAQDGTGFTWRDDPIKPVGGNCYNCHQISPKEMAFGSVGPSLYQFGKNRGNTEETQKYVYSKIFNAKAYNLCSAMPRFGHIGALSPENIKNLVALLLDPESPVNK